MKLGLSGRLTEATIRSPLTPLFLLAALAMGMLALIVIPREEEPQISVPMVDIAVRADGLKAPDAVELVTKPLEAIVKGIDGVEHVYSQTQDDRAMVTHASWSEPRLKMRSFGCTRRSGQITTGSPSAFPSR